MAKIDRVQEVGLQELIPYAKNAKVHNQAQIDKIAKSIEEFGFINPCLIDKDKNIIAGHGRVMAAKQLGMKTVPCIYVEGLTKEQYKAYVLADNKLGELAEWDMEIVYDELQFLNDMDFDFTITGFDTISDFDPIVNERKDLSGEIKSTYEVIIECDDEMMQEDTFNKLTEKGYTCRVLTL